MAAANKYDEFIQTLIALKVSTSVIEEHMKTSDQSMAEIKELLWNHVDECNKRPRECDKRFVTLEAFQDSMKGVLYKVVLPIMLIAIAQLIATWFRVF